MKSKLNRPLPKEMREKNTLQLELQNNREQEYQNELLM